MSDKEKKQLTDEEMFAQMEGMQNGAMTAVTSQILKLADGESANFKAEGEEPFEGDFGIQPAIVLKDKTGLKIMAPQAVVLSSIQDLIKEKKLKYPIWVRIIGGKMATPKKGGNDYQLFTVLQA